MAKKMPNIKAPVAQTQASPNTIVDKTAKTPAVVASTKPQKAAVAVDSKKAEPKKTKKTKKASDRPNIFKRMWKGIKGIFSELKKVTWPKGKDVAKATGVVIAVIFMFFIILFGIDYVLSGLLGLIVNGTWTTLFI